MPVVAFLSLLLAIAAAGQFYIWWGARSAARDAKARPSHEHWTERRVRRARALAARRGAIFLGSAAVVLEGVATLLR